MKFLTDFKPNNKQLREATSLPPKQDIEAVSLLSKQKLEEVSPKVKQIFYTGLSGPLRALKPC